MNLKFHLLISALFILLLSSCTPDQNGPSSSGSVDLSLRVVNVYNDPMEGAEVYLYTNQSDYVNMKNSVYSVMTTDVSGMVYIGNLQARAYYIRIQKGALTNKNGN